MKHTTEIVVFILSGVFLLFLWLAFDERMATLYLLMLFVAYVILDKFNLVYRIESRIDNRAMAFFTASIAYVIFLVVTTFIFSLFSALAQFADFQSIIQLYATSTPILQGSVFLTILAWGFIIPTIETLFFFGFLFGILILMTRRSIGVNVSTERINIPIIIIMIICSSLFTLFHITSKGLANLPLIITFIFAIFSCVLVFKTKEIKSAILLHIIANLVAVLSSLGLIFSSVGG